MALCARSEFSVQLKQCFRLGRLVSLNLGHVTTQSPLLRRNALDRFEGGRADHVVHRILDLTQSGEKRTLTILQFTLPFRRGESLGLQRSDDTTLSSLDGALPFRRCESLSLERRQVRRSAASTPWPDSSSGAPVARRLAQSSGWGKQFRGGDGHLPGQSDLEDRQRWDVFCS